MTRIFIEGFEVDVDKDLVNRITYSIDDLENLDSKTTSFTKTIVLPGSENNNNILGNIFDFNNSNFTNNVDPNVKYNFNAAKVANCRFEQNGLLIMKGVFRLLEIVYDGKQIEYECSIFGELGGLMSKIGNLRLEDLDFSAYDQDWTDANIRASWANANTGNNVYYPLVDIGQVSNGPPYGVLKKDYQYRAFRPALHVREYLDKIITNAGYTWESAFFDTDFFKRLIIPHNSKALTTISQTALEVSYSGAGQSLISPTDFLGVAQPTQPTLGSFTTSDNITFTYNGVPRIEGSLFARIQGIYTYTQLNPDFSSALRVRTRWRVGGVDTYTFTYFEASATPQAFDFVPTSNVFFNTGDSISFEVVADSYPAPNNLDTWDVLVTSCEMKLTTASPNPVQLNLGEAIIMNDTIPRGIYQKDFFASILKMHYLMVTEDKFREKHLIITPWVDFFNLDRATYEDWSNKVDFGKQVRIKPMSEINARFYEIKYKSDTDFYIDSYKKKYNEGYGDMFFDNGFEFSKEKETVEVIFANAVLVGYAGEDKVVPSIFKKTNEVEERIDHVIRIMQAKKVTGVTSWDIMNGVTVLSSNTDYPYAGHLDDPDAPNADICFGVPRELFFVLVSGNLSNNLFNAFYSSYMAEITDKDSRLLQAMLKLNDIDIYNLDFSTFKFINGGLYRLQKLIDYAAGQNETTKTELLRVINTTYS